MNTIGQSSDRDLRALIALISDPSGAAARLAELQAATKVASDAEQAAVVAKNAAGESQAAAKAAQESLDLTKEAVAKAQAEVKAAQAALAQQEARLAQTSTEISVAAGKVANREKEIGRAHV